MVMDEWWSRGGDGDSDGGGGGDGDSDGDDGYGDGYGDDDGGGGDSGGGDDSGDGSQRDCSDCGSIYVTCFFSHLTSFWLTSVHRPFCLWERTC